MSWEYKHNPMNHQRQLHYIISLCNFITTRWNLTDLDDSGLYSFAKYVLRSRAAISMDLFNMRSELTLYCLRKGSIWLCHILQITPNIATSNRINANILQRIKGFVFKLLYQLALYSRDLLLLFLKELRW